MNPPPKPVPRPNKCRDCRYCMIKNYIQSYQVFCRYEPKPLLINENDIACSKGVAK